MDYDNYMELYEAVYFFNRIKGCMDQNLPEQINKTEIKRLGINESVYRAIMRILVVNNLLDYDGSCFVMSDASKEKHHHILEHIINKNQNGHYAVLFDKAVSKFQFFFDSISESEYDIYSRYNFPITLNIGKEVAKHVDLAHKKVLELGGNSGGLGTALVTKHKECLYTVVDTKIPCRVGNEYKQINELNLKFIEGDVFELMLPNEIYDYIIIMNLLHDFDDIKCLNILRNCTKHCDSNTKFLIIEDVLTSEFEPKEIIMHGLRLSVECQGGRQRSKETLAHLFSNINYELEKTVKINNIHTMLVMGAL